MGIKLGHFLKSKKSLTTKHLEVKDGKCFSLFHLYSLWRLVYAFSTCHKIELVTVAAHYILQFQWQYIECCGSFWSLTIPGKTFIGQVGSGAYSRTNQLGTMGEIMLCLMEVLVIIL